MFFNDVETDPFIFLSMAAKGMIRDKKDGKTWIPGVSPDIGMYAFESMRSIAEALMASMAAKSAQGQNIGGGSNVAFQVQGDGQTLKVSGSNMAHFGVTQARITEEVWNSQKLPARYILWTSSVSKDEDVTAGGKVLGPDVIGKALTAEVPRWFNLTFRIDVVPAQMGKGERHVLYLGNHVDIGAGNAAGLGNTRMPLDAPALTATNNTIEPADLVKALALLDGGKEAAKNAIKARLGLKSSPNKD